MKIECRDIVLRDMIESDIEKLCAIDYKAFEGRVYKLCF